MIQSDQNASQIVFLVVFLIVVVCKFLLINLLHQRLMLLIRIVVNE